MSWLVPGAGTTLCGRPNCSSRSRPGLLPVTALLAVGLLALIAVILVTPGLRDVADLLWLKLRLLLGMDV